jgi:hypothetical protein
MKMVGLYLAVLMALGWFPLKWLLPFPGLYSPATYARHSAPYREIGKKMDLIEQYLSRSKEIIGDRSDNEIRYDNEVLKWMRKGKKVKNAILKANKKYHNEALKFDRSNIGDIADHYNYLLEHENILKNLKR